jgi:hypothetical protein
MNDKWGYLFSCLALWATAASTQNFQDVYEADIFGKSIHQLNGYYTESAKKYLKQKLAADFEAEAPKAGFPPDLTKSFANAIQYGQVNRVSGGAHGFVVAAPNGAFIPDAPSPQTNFIYSFIKPEKMNFYLQKFSTIKLEVQPAPPRDYSVVINGEKCPATDEGIYKVLPGNADVNVTRPAIAPCIWHGPVTEGQIQVVNCKL